MSTEIPDLTDIDDLDAALDAVIPVLRILNAIVIEDVVETDEMTDREIAGVLEKSYHFASVITTLQALRDAADNEDSVQDTGDQMSRQKPQLYDEGDILESRYNPEHRYIVVGGPRNSAVVTVRVLTGPLTDVQATITSNMLKLSAHRERLPIRPSRLNSTMAIVSTGKVRTRANPAS